MKKKYLKPTITLYRLRVDSLLTNVSDVQIGGKGPLDAKGRNVSYDDDWDD